MYEQQQALLIKIVDLFARRFDRRAVLRGGMVLRILGCERWTNDLDYLFVPHESKKEIVDEVLEVLNDLTGATTRYSLNSQCLRVVVEMDGVSVQVEIKVATEAHVLAVSNAALARTYQLPPRLIAVIDHADALSNKLAAWNERRLARDLYDIWFFLSLGIRPNTSVLKERLRNPRYSKLLKRAEQFPGSEVNEFYVFLREHVKRMDENVIVAELESYLPIDRLAGFKMMLMAALVDLR